MKKRVLICQNIVDLGRDTDRMLHILGLDTARCSSKNSDVIQRLSAEHFDGLIFYVLHIYDKRQLIRFLTELRCRFPELSIYAIVLSCTDELSALMDSLRITRILGMPVESSRICQLIMEDLCTDDETVVLSYIVSFVKKESVPTHLSGFWYVCSGVQLSLLHPELLDSVTSGLYVSIAQRMGVHTATVERSIRHLLSVMSKNGRTVCGVSPDQLRSRELIALLADAFASHYDIYRRSGECFGTVSCEPPKIEYSELHR